MKKLPEGYEIKKLPDGSERLLKKEDHILMYWDMDGTKDGYFETGSTATTNKEEMKEILAVMTAYLEGAK